MSRSDCWSILNLEPTEDMRAIKRAYARALKAIDVDRNPTAFGALRDAFEDAKFRALYGDYDDCDLEDEHLPDTEDDPSVPDQPGTPYREAPRELIDPGDLELAPAGIDDRFARLDRLLFETEEAAPNDIDDAVRSIVSNNHMGDLDFAIDTENRLAAVLAEAVPRSDPALATAINAFGWHRRERDWKLSPAVAQVMQRYRDCFYLAKIAKPDSFYRNAYRRLAKPPPGHWSPAHWFGLSAIRDLLNEIRSEHPTVELHLNPDSVLWWEGRAAPMASGSRTMIAGLIAKAAAAVAGAMLWDTHRLWGALIGIWAATGCQSLIIFLVRTYANARMCALIASPDEDRRAVALDIFWLTGLPTVALLSTAIPFTLAGILLLGLMAIGLAALATIRGIVPGRANEPGRAFFPFLASTWWLAAYVFIPRPLWWQGLIPVLALCWAGFFGIGRIGKYVDTLHLWHHRTAIGAHMLLAPIAAIAVQGYPALGAAAVSAWTVAHYGLSARLASWQLSLPAFYIIGLVIYQILGFTARADMPHLTMTILACLLVGTGTIRLILMWRELRLA